METILKNGNFITMEELPERIEAVAVQFGRIARTGVSDEIEKLARQGTRIIDLEGNTVLPGFIDAHNHFCLNAFLVDQVDCRPSAGCVRGNDIIEALREKASRTETGKWIMGWGYAAYLLDDKKDITRDDLDRATRDHPVCLVHVSVHGAVVNSLALEELNYRRDTPDPPGGKIHRSKDGDLNGTLSESAIMSPLFFASPSI